MDVRITNLDSLGCIWFPEQVIFRKYFGKLPVLSCLFYYCYWSNVFYRADCKHVAYLLFVAFFSSFVIFDMLCASLHKVVFWIYIFLSKKKKKKKRARSISVQAPCSVHTKQLLVSGYPRVNGRIWTREVLFLPPFRPKFTYIIKKKGFEHGQYFLMHFNLWPWEPLNLKPWGFYSSWAIK